MSLVVIYRTAQLNSKQGRANVGWICSAGRGSDSQARCVCWRTNTVPGYLGTWLLRYMWSYTGTSLYGPHFQQGPLVYCPARLACSLATDLTSRLNMLPPADRHKHSLTILDI